MNEFVIGVDDFDVDLLPEEARDRSSEAFRRAVAAWFSERIAAAGATGVVGVDDERIVVSYAFGSAEEPGQRAVELLQAGQIEKGVGILEALDAIDALDMSDRFNLGMALSDQGRLGDAARHLERVVAAEPRFSSALVALGVAQYRMDDLPAARESLEKALRVDPQDGYAHRNLGVVLSAQGAADAAGIHFRKAHVALPNDPQSTFGLARWLVEHGDGANDLGEADDLLRGLIESAPRSHPIVEMAKEERSKIAMRNLRDVGGPVRMDAVMYLLGAIQKFEKMPRSKIQEVGFEVAMLGQRGLDVNSPEQKYTLRTMPGMYSGLHLMAYMYAAFQVIQPGMDIGFDLSREYETAVAMHKGKA